MRSTRSRGISRSCRRKRSTSTCSNPAHRDFGDYELQGKLGQGGMGVVYRARQKSLEREVALKLLAAGPWASADFIARFRREAQSAARMQHPNIVPIYEIGAHEELNFFSMMLVRGPTLGQVLAEQGPFEPRATRRRWSAPSPRRWTTRIAWACCTSTSSPATC